MRTCARCRLDADATASPRCGGTRCAGVFDGQAQTEPSFYAGKQITLIAGSGVGGGYDLLARLAARHLGRLIPGHPDHRRAEHAGRRRNLVATNQNLQQRPEGRHRHRAHPAWYAARQVEQSERRALQPSSRNSTGWEISTAKPASFSPGTRRRIGLAQDLFEQELIVGGQTGVDPEITPRLYNSLGWHQLRDRHRL